MFLAEDLSYAGRSFCRNFFALSLRIMRNAANAAFSAFCFCVFRMLETWPCKKTAGEGFIKNMPLAKKNIFFVW